MWRPWHLISRTRHEFKNHRTIVYSDSFYRCHRCTPVEIVTIRTATSRLEWYCSNVVVSHNSNLRNSDYANQHKKTMFKKARHSQSSLAFKIPTRNQMHRHEGSYVGYFIVWAVITSGLLQTLITLVMTAQTMSFRCELACKGFSAKSTSFCDITKLSLLFYRCDLYNVS